MSTVTDDILSIKQELTKQLATLAHVDVLLVNDLVQDSDIDDLQKSILSLISDVSFLKLKDTSNTEVLNKLELGLTTLSSEYFLLKTLYDTLDSSINSNNASLLSAISALTLSTTDSINTLTTSSTANAQAVLDLESNITQDINGIVTATASSIQTLSAKVDGTHAAVIEEKLALATSLTAMASDITTLSGEVTNYETNVTGYFSAVTALSGRVTNTEGDISSQLTSIQALEVGVADTNAAMTVESSLRVSAENAIADSVTLLTTRVGDAETTVAVTASSVNGLLGQYSVKIDANGYIAGYGLANTAATDLTTSFSEFSINASRFSIVNDINNSLISPFVVQGSSVYMNTAVIENGSINSLMIGSYIESDNYVPATSGWHINKDGVAEFSGIIIRDSSGGVVFASNTGMDWAYLQGLGGPDINATVGAPNGTFVGSMLVEDVVNDLTTLINDYNATNNDNYDAIVAPTITTGGTALQHTVNTDGSSNLTFEWEWSGLEQDIDGFFIVARASYDSASYVIGTTVNVEQVAQLPASKRVAIWRGVASDQYYTVGVMAYRKVTPTTTFPEGLITSSSFVQPLSIDGENPYQPETQVAFTGQLVGTLLTDNINKWSQITDDLGNRPDDNANNTADPNALIGTVLVSDLLANLDSVLADTTIQNNANYAPIVAPVVASDGSAFLHTLNTDGSANVSMQWSWSGVESEIDGFMLIMRASTSSAVYTIPTNANEERVLGLLPDVRVKHWDGVPSDLYYTVGIRAYRRVTPNGTHPTGLITSPIAYSTHVLENPYRPSADIPKFSGSLVNSAGTPIPVTTLITNLDTLVTDYNTSNNNNYTSVLAPTIPIDALIHTVNTDGSVNVKFSWGWSGVEQDIDGFVIFARSSYTSEVYEFLTTVAEETSLQVPANKRDHIFFGIPADLYYTVGILAYRKVTYDAVQAPNGVLASTLVKVTNAGENPFRPSAGITFNGNIDYTNVNGTKPPSNADKTGDNTALNIVGQGALATKSSISSSDVLNGAITAVKTAIAAIDPASGNLTANSVTATQINVGTLSAITANLGSVNAGNITGNANIDIVGQAKFRGVTVNTEFGNAAVTANDTTTKQPYGVIAYGNQASVIGILGSTSQGVYGGSGANNGVFGLSSASFYAGVSGTSSNSSGYGVKGYSAYGTGVYATTSSGTALYCNGTMLKTGTELVSNLNADSVDGYHVSNGSGNIPISNGAINTNLNADKLDSYQGGSYIRYVNTQSGTTYSNGSSGIGFQMSGSLAASYRTYSNTSSTFYITDVSDERLKQDIKPETLGLNFINKVEPKVFRMKADPKILHHGFIAQDMEKLIGDVNVSSLCTEEADGIKGVGYLALIAPLVKSVQELSKEVTELKKQLKEVK